MAELQQRCQLLSTELIELRQSLAAEHQHRSHAEDMLRQTQEQLSMQQQLTARTGEPVSVASDGDTVAELLQMTKQLGVVSSADARRQVKASRCHLSFLCALCTS